MMNKNCPGRIGLLSFLKNAVKCARKSTLAGKQPIYVLGNSSADLDSIISAIIYSYFATSARNESYQYIPVINLPDVHSGRELRKFRPEFTTALNLATQRPWNSSPVETKENLKTFPEDEKTDELLTESIMTIADLRNNFLRQRGHSDMNACDLHPEVAQSQQSLNIFMVDWNSLPSNPSSGFEIEGISNKIKDINVSVLGCIDHHKDEGFIARHVKSNPDIDNLSEPQWIQTGVGSCTSMVVRELRSRGWWDDCHSSLGDYSLKNTPSDEELENCSYENKAVESQAAQLALAAILADTANMTAKDKVSDIDREAVLFLESKINQCESISWDRNAFYQHIMQAKSSSVDFLTVDETLGRDYKEWLEEPSPTHTLKIGICAVVKSLSWLLEKCGSEDPQSTSNEEAFLRAIESFGQSRNLDVVAIMTAFSSPPDEKFQRELVVTVLNNAYVSRLEAFRNAATSDLGLDEGPIDRNKITTLGGVGKSTWVWKQHDLTKSRKQVAPFMREVFTLGV